MGFIRYLRQVEQSFKNDPPDTDYQRGYLAAVLEMLRVAETSEQEGVRD